MTDGYFLVAIIEAIKHHLENARHSIYLYRMSLSGELNHLKRIMKRTHEPGKRSSLSLDIFSETFKMVNKN